MVVHEQVSLNRAVRRILLAGDINKAFTDVNHSTAMVQGAVTTGMQCEVYPQLQDAIDTSVKNNFEAIAVVISGASVKLSSALKALRDKCGARIILLAQMYEEPMAIRLADSYYNGRPLVDDYLICPVQMDKFLEFVTNPQGLDLSRRLREQAVETFHPDIIDTAIKKKIEYLEKLATEDDLTGLKNRRYIYEFSRQIIEHAAKENGRVTLLLFDVDNLKQYNDLYGHYAGDEILRQAAALMRRCCRTHDVIGRIGGDEFAVVFWDVTSIPESGIEQIDKNERRLAAAEHPNEAISIAKRFVSELENTPAPIRDEIGGGLGPDSNGVLTISGGLASFPRDGATAQELFEQADKALLEAKRSGKNRIYLVGKPQKDIG